MLRGRRFGAGDEEERDRFAEFDDDHSEMGAALDDINLDLEEEEEFDDLTIEIPPEAVPSAVVEPAPPAPVETPRAAVQEAPTPPAPKKAPARALVKEVSKKAVKKAPGMPVKKAAKKLVKPAAPEAAKKKVAKAAPAGKTAKKAPARKPAIKKVASKAAAKKRKK
jgi:outer membrane biosynthesis protein TonB